MPERPVARRRYRPRSVRELERLMAVRARLGLDDMDVAPEELAGLHAESLGATVLWVTPSWALRARFHAMDRLTVLRAPWGITVEVMRTLPTDRSTAAAVQGYAYLGLLDQEVRGSHRLHPCAHGTSVEVPGWTRLANHVAHSWLLTVAHGDALDACLTALALDEAASRRVHAALGPSAPWEVPVPAYHAWEGRLGDGGWGPSEPLFRAVDRNHGVRADDWAERRRLARVAIATGRVRPAAAD